MKEGLNKPEEKNIRLEQLAENAADRFFDDFRKRNFELLKSKAFGIIGVNLEAEIHRLVIAEEKEKGKEYTDLLIKKLLACLDFYQPLIRDEENDPKTKEGARNYLLALAAPGGSIGLDYNG